MKTIWKQQLAEMNYQALRFPQGAKILTVQVQNEFICIWAECDSEEARVEVRHFFIFETGQLIPKPESGRLLVYLGSVQLKWGKLAFHIYEEKNA